jgi:hypothetical protein
VNSGNFCYSSLQRLSLELKPAVDFLLRTNVINIT